VALGLAIGLGYPILAARASNARVGRWVVEESKSPDVTRIQRTVEMTQLGLVPPWTQVSPWPGVALGGGMVALGLLLLKARRRDRSGPKISAR